jgi:hypothetical protein
VRGVQPVPPSAVVELWMPQRLGPPRPHAFVELQVPHWSTPPQPSPIGPQFAFAAVQVVGVQGGPPPH